jgi:hypothetical protein
MADPANNGDDDYGYSEMHRMASNNPAMTVPASELLSHSDFEQLRSRSSINTRRGDESGAGGGSIAVRKARKASSSQSSPPAAAAGVPSSTFDHSAPLPPASKYEVGWRRVVRNFSPSWFSVTMGTGIVSLLLIGIPFQADWLYWLSVMFFGLNTVLFSLALTTSFLRYTLYPEIWTVMIADSTNSLFLGTVPMGFATLVESWIVLCCPYWGPWSVTFAWVCWMVDAVVAAAVTVSLPFLLMSQSSQSTLDRITAAQLLPVAATIVAAGAGQASRLLILLFLPEPKM